MYKIFNNVEDILIFQGNEKKFIIFTNKIQDENEDLFILETQQQCKSYIDRYCDNLTLLISAKKE